jgi:hypothetical protein
VNAILTIDIAMTKFDDYIVDVLMRDLVGHDRKPACFLVYLWLAAEQQRRGAAVQVSYQEIAESIGVSKSSAQSAVGWLTRRKLLVIRKKTVTAMPSYRVLSPWRQEDRGRPSKEYGRESSLRAGTNL